MAFLIAAVSCGGGSGTNQNQTPPRTENEVEEPVVAEAIDIAGTDVDELIDQWVEVGEDEDFLQTRLDPGNETEHKPTIMWHIAEIAAGNMDEYEVDLEAGEYWFQGIGGSGIEKLDFYVYEEEAEEALAMDDAEDNFPMVYFDLLDDQTVTFKVDPAVFEGDRESGLYCWYLYEG